MFPRSQGQDPDKGATFDDCIRRLPEIAAMGFDVVYLPPIHPIGRVHRKGRDNMLNAGPDDPGSPYAIGAAEGGHTAVHPELGTLEDFRGFVTAAGRHGMDVALDFAIQCAPDHPWVREYPEWFTFRPDGSIKYAENPPKKYQDIVNVNFYGPHRAALWAALRDVVLFWAEQGVRTFRVDNPHTKPVPFWEWLIGDVRARHPDVIFLSEAFTRPPMLKMLAKVGFSQSYSYFTWRNEKQELTEYLTELTQSEAREYLMPNFFANTPDILPGFLQTGGRPAFKIRLVLAATLSTVYGIYNGFELCENAAVPNSEEYLHSEKYQYKVWDWDRPGHIKDYVAAVNWIRRENAALHRFDNLRFHTAYDDAVLLYSKAADDLSNRVLIAVCLDPHNTHEADIDVPLYDFGLAEGHPFEAAELLSGERHTWTGSRQRIRLTPDNPAAIYRITP
jgi:starch synthase (maltosyl-transferring)